MSSTPLEDAGGRRVVLPALCPPVLHSSRQVVKKAAVAEQALATALADSTQMLLPETQAHRTVPPAWCFQDGHVGLDQKGLQEECMLQL